MPKKSTKRRPVRKKVTPKKRPVRKKAAPGTTKKSARKSVGGRPFKKGADPRRGRGPKKGAPNAGRPSNELVERCQKAGLAMVLPKIMTYLKKKAKDPDDAGWRWAADLMLDRGFGKATQPIEAKPPLNDDERIDMLRRILQIAEQRLGGSA